MIKYMWQAFEEWLYSSLDECFAQEANNCNLELTVGKKADWASIVSNKGFVLH